MTTGGAEPRHSALPTAPLTLAVFVVTASVSIAGLLDEHLLHTLRRDGDAISSGQAWRLITSLVVQDGGVPGTLFNLLGLLAVGAFAERALGRPIWSAAYLAGALTGEIVGWAGWQPIGAGNSVGVCGLAGALAVAIAAGDDADVLAAIVCVAWATALLAETLTIAAPVISTVVTRLAAVKGGAHGTRLAVAAFVGIATTMLLAQTDIHGAALLAGAAVGLVARRAPGFVLDPANVRRTIRP